MLNKEQREVAWNTWKENVLPGEDFAQALFETVEAVLAEYIAALARAEQEARTAKEQLARIESWCEAYPLDVFPFPEWNEVKRLLGDTLLSQVSAANMRHVVLGVKKIARDQAAKEGTNAETND